jgi:hypothetical protein
VTPAVSVAAVAAAVAGSVVGAGVFSGSDNPWPYQAQSRSPVLAVVGDISCQPGDRVEKEKPSDVCAGDSTRNAAQTATANQIEQMQPDLVAILGDEQYQAGRYPDLPGSFDRTYGAFKFLQRPAAGNHEFYTSHGEAGDNGDGYFDYYDGYQLNADSSPVVTAPAAPPATAPPGRAVPEAGTRHGDRRGRQPAVPACPIDADGV